MQELIERLEAATGPDRELDGLIFKAVYEKPGDVWHKFNDCWMRRDPNDTVAYDPPEAYTKFVDDALLLVPAECWARVQTATRDTRPIAWVSSEHEEDQSEAVEGATPAIALCIAALKFKSAAFLGSEQK